MLVAKFNTSFMCVIFVSMGIITEVVAHFAMALSFTMGDLEERLGVVLTDTLPAVLAASLATLLLCLPLCFLQVPHYLHYGPLMVAVLVGVVLVNMFVVLPAIVAVIDPMYTCFRNCCRCDPP